MPAVANKLLGTEARRVYGLEGAGSRDILKVANEANLFFQHHVVRHHKTRIYFAARHCSPAGSWRGAENSLYNRNLRAKGRFRSDGRRL
jgi:hypothetical protein